MPSPGELSEPPYATMLGVTSDRDEVHETQPLLVRERVLVGAGLRRLVGRLVILPGEVRFEPYDGPPIVNTSGRVVVKRSWLAPLVANTDIVLGVDHRSGHECIVLRTSAFSDSAVISAIQRAGFVVDVERKMF